MVDLGQGELVHASLASESVSGEAGQSLAGLLDDIGVSSTRLGDRVELVAALDRLEEQGLVERTTHLDGDDAGTGVRVRLTEAGRAQAEERLARLLETTIEVVNDGRKQLTVEAAADCLDRPPVSIAAATTSDGVYYCEQATERRFVGRESALETARDVIEGVHDGEGRVLLLSGPPGVGKTTLADRVLAAARESGLTVLRARARGDGATAYQPFRDLLADLEGDPLARAGPAVEDADAFRAQQTSLFHDLTQLLAPPDEARDGPQDGVGDEFPDGTDGVADDGVPDHPDDETAPPARVVYVDDLHLADGGTLAYLEYLFEAVADRRLLVVGSYRPAELPERAAIPPDQTDEVPVTHVELDPFRREQTRALLSGLLETRRIPDGFVEAVHDWTGGSPLFVETTVESLLETNQLAPELDVYPESAAEIDVPGEVRETIDHYVRQFPDPARELLRWAALLGVRFETALLAAVTDLRTTHLRTYLESFVDGGVFDRSDDHLSFRSEVVREALLEDLGDDERLERHGAVAAALEERDGGDPAAIAHHRERAGDHERAIAAYRRAAHQATAVYAHETAIEHLQDALALARESDDRKTLVELAIEVTAVHETVGEYEEARRFAQFARQRAVTAAGRRLALAKLASVATARGDHERAIELATEGLEIGGDGLDGADDGPGTDDLDGGDDLDGDDVPNADEVTCRLLGQLSSAQQELGRYEAARETAKRRRRLATGRDDDEQLAAAVNDLGTIAASRADYEQAREYHEKGLAIYREIGDGRGVARSLRSLGNVAREQGEYERAREYHEESLAIYREIDDRHGVARSLKSLGIVAWEQGAYERGREYSRESLPIFREVGDRHGVAKTRNNLGIVAWELGEYERAEEHYEESLPIYREVGDRHGVAKSLGNLGLVARTLGEYERAREYADESLAIYREVGDRHGVAKNLTVLGNVASERGDLERAREYYEESLAIERELGTRHHAADNLVNLGQVARALGEYERAREYAEESMAIYREIGARPGVVKSLGTLGTVAAELGANDRAVDHFERAAEAAIEVGEETQAAACLAHRGALAFRAGDPETGRATGDRSLQRFQAVGTVPASHEGIDPVEAIRELVEAASDAGHGDTAREWCHRTLAALEGSRVAQEQRRWFERHLG